MHTENSIPSLLLLVAFFLLGPMPAQAAENVVLKDKRILFDIEVMGNSPGFVVIQHKKGTDSYRWELLPKDFRKKYQPDYVDTVPEKPVEIVPESRPENVSFVTYQEEYEPDNEVQSDHEKENTMPVEVNDSSASDSIATRLLDWGKRNARGLGVGIALVIFILFYLFR